MKKGKKLLAGVLSVALLMGMAPTQEASAAKKVRLSSKKITVTKGKSKTLKVKNTKKKVKWKVLSGKKYISLKKKGKTAATIKGKKKGTAKVQAIVGKKKLTCKVTVKNPAKKTTSKPAVTKAPVATKTDAPTPGAGDNATATPGTDNKPTATPPASSSTEPPAKDSGMYDAEGNLTKTWDDLLEDETVAVTDGELTGCNTELKGNLVIPENITSIGDWTFDECSGLTNITVPSSVTSIGDYAFYDCSGLTSITIPSSVTSIGDSAFEGCSGLTRIVVSEENEVYDSRENCNAIIETETNMLMAGCKNTSIPSSVTSIGAYAFCGCEGLTSISIPSSVTSIEWGAFGHCSGLTSIIVSEENEVYDSRENCNAIILTETNMLIAGCKNTIIPSSVTDIVDEAFYGCSGLTNITVPSSVTSIGDYAFCGCEGLTSISIPSSVISIGDFAFRYCSGLANIIVSEENEVYDSRENCNAIIETETNMLVAGCKNTSIPSGVTGIGDSAFEGCSGLTSISIPSSVTSIGNFAFCDCESLTSISIPSSVTDIEFDAFDGIPLVIYDGDATDYEDWGADVVQRSDGTVLYSWSYS